MNRAGFTLVELLVTVAVLVSLSMMASGLYMSYVREGEESVVRNNLTAMRGALQQFYADNGRFPYQSLDHYGNAVGFLDDAASELVQGPHRGFEIYPKRRIRYLINIPIDPSLNSKSWQMVTEPFKITADAPAIPVVTNIRSFNDLLDHL